MCIKLKMVTFITTYAATSQGMRSYMEDTHVYTKIGEKRDMYLIGVFDGHGGKDVAELCSKSLAPILSQCLNTHKNNTALALRKTYATLDELAKFHDQFMGCTAATVLVDHPNKKIWFANAGDSMSMVIYVDGSFDMMSFEHKASDMSEKQRIHEAGGIVLNIDGVERVNGMLNVARSIGDHYLKQSVISDPYITYCETNRVKYIISASDGIWDVYNAKSLTKEIVDMYNNKNRQMNTVVKEIVSKAYMRGSTDNITLVIVELR